MAAGTNVVLVCLELDGRKERVLHVSKHAGTRSATTRSGFVKIMISNANQALAGPKSSTKFSMSQV